MDKLSGNLLAEKALVSKSGRESKPKNKKVKKSKKSSKDKTQKKSNSKKKKRKRQASSSSNSSDSSAISSSSSESSEDEKAKKRKKKSKKNKAKKQKAKLEASQLKVIIEKTPVIIATQVVKIMIPEADVGPHIDLKSSKIRAPMTKEEYEKQQSTLKWITDPETGTKRLIRGSGEIVEEMISKERPQMMKPTPSTLFAADGNFFQPQSNMKARSNYD
ncbi:ADP-ribosylation factor-like protein 6-interacting protein 4 [Daphnia magna]|uniref:ADP-ribosylation factor-like protein 6-interacting protein 4 n=1 Tax=Daphnia magna TaxID=35525 RepID=A0ABQ9ZQ77_9CRUS|nr:ADP-ribosylation factor-like protein 6-interacting protein 4 [Daphnia magna]KAK4014755.1 hypothetical protein OUZ56_027263 [Daphnia magna]